MLNKDKPQYTSINFLDNLKELGIEKENSMLQLKVKWAPIILQNRSNNDIVEISNDYYDVITSFVNKHKNPDEKSFIEVIGKIVYLKAVAIPNKRENGIITIIYTPNDSLKDSRIKSELDYRL